MLKKTLIRNMAQFDQLVQSASSIVIYGSKTQGRLVVNHLISGGMAEKLSGIVHTNSYQNYEDKYREIPIYLASKFFESPENRNSLVIVSVKTSMTRAEIFEALEKYGVESCVYLDWLNTSLLFQMACSAIGRPENEDDMISCVFVEDQLLDLIRGASEVVIYGTKRNKDMLEKYFNMINCGPHIIKSFEVIQKEPNGMYKNIEPFTKDAAECEDVLILVAIDSLNTNYKSLGKIRDIDAKNCYYCTDELMERIFIQLKNGKKKVSVREPQFVVAGFPKCGSTSLHYVLQDIKDIYVPDAKEPKYLLHKDSLEDPRGKWLHSFFDRVPQDQIPGCVDPIFALYPKQARETFGPDVKVGFIMRNPVNTTYSYFKMWIRFGDSSCRCRYDKYERYCSAMFDDYISYLPQDRWQFFNYANVLEDFLEYYPMGQIQVIIFEELIQNPGKIINTFLRFIGSKEIYDARQGIRKENIGDYVWANDEGWELGMKSHELLEEKDTYLKWRILDDPETALARANEIENELFRIGRLCEAAEKIYNPQMTPEQQKRLEDFYRPSVRKLEKMLNKDLSKLWFE